MEKSVVVLVRNKVPFPRGREVPPMKRNEKIWQLFRRKKVKGGF